MAQSYDPKMISPVGDVKRSISFWQEYLRYVKDGMLEFDERAEYYIECLGRRVERLVSFSRLVHIRGDKLEAEGSSDDDDTDEESPFQRRPGKVSYCGYIMRRYRPY